MTSETPGGFSWSQGLPLPTQDKHISHTIAKGCGHVMGHHLMRRRGVPSLISTSAAAAVGLRGVIVDLLELKLAARVGDLGCACRRRTCPAHAHVAPMSYQR